MGRSGGSQRSRRRQQAMHIFSISQQIVSFFVLVSIVLPFMTRFTEGRIIPSQGAALSQTQGGEEEEARIISSQIGSRPPRCAGRCYSCGHCEAIQVPTNPQVGRAGVLSSTTGVYFRGDYGSNYKPMSWKCKCGNSIFNP